MLNRTVDLTKLCAFKEIQYILSQSNEYRSNIILQNRDYQQQLIKYVLSNINHRYMTIENLTQIPVEASEIFPQCPIYEQIAIRQLLHIGMTEIARSLLERAEKHNLKMGKLT